MLKRLSILFAVGVLLLGAVGIAQATLTTIGTATYGGADYKLIWDNDNNGNSVIWLDYTRDLDQWQPHMNWAAALSTALVYNINPAYSVIWEDTQWRLPRTYESLANLSSDFGYQGPNPSGYHDYKWGYNMTNSELGHLYYEELGNLGQLDTSGDFEPEYGLTKTGDFENIFSAYVGIMSNTEYSLDTDFIWGFSFGSSNHGFGYKTDFAYALAVRSAQVTPEPGTLLLLGIGLLGVASARRRC